MVLQAALRQGLAFDPFAFEEDGLVLAEVDVGRGKTIDALVMAAVIVVLDESCDLPFEVAWRIVVFQKNAVLLGLVPALDLALGWGW